MIETIVISSSCSLCEQRGGGEIERGGGEQGSQKSNHNTEQRENTRAEPQRERHRQQSPPPDAGPPNPGEQQSAEAEMPPVTKEQSVSETEKDSGYSDSSSESVSSEDTPPSTSASVMAATPPTQPAYTPIYILQNIILKQPRLVLLHAPVKHHRKRASPSSYLPILRSYPKIAPRLPPPPSSASDLPIDTALAPPQPKQAAPADPGGLPALAGLAAPDTRDSEAHTRLYERALQGEEGGWERLRRAMERSGGYRQIPPAAPNSGTTEEAMNTTEASSATSDSAEMTEEEEEVTSPEEAMTSSDAAPPTFDLGGAV
ncbi:unnamed protein product [Ranitomeya imitator]|uniref:Uncharacterized protein n=1 Tax=Ranitomeya imitator TaxID=111125 RepID=A0ABN9LQZ9_9NEOB|nr:unnamed protein product [Ranitomeya imitator]